MGILLFMHLQNKFLLANNNEIVILYYFIDPVDDGNPGKEMALIWKK